jgi:hypothetical protein
MQTLIVLLDRATHQPQRVVIEILNNAPRAILLNMINVLQAHTFRHPINFDILGPNYPMLTETRTERICSFTVGGKTESPPDLDEDK